MTQTIPPLKPKRHVNVVLSTTTLMSFLSVSRATALALAELGVAAFFTVGVVRSFIGEKAPWLILAACAASALVRIIDIESWALFIPGGLPGRAERAFGPRIGSLATAAVLTERLLFVSTACVLCGQYALSVGVPWIAEWSVTARLTVQELVVVGATILIGLLWIRFRLGFPLPSPALARAVWVGIAIIGIVILFGLRAALKLDVMSLARSWPLPWTFGNSSIFGNSVQLLGGLALVLPVLGGGDVLARVAHEFAPPRLQALQRTSFFLVVFTFLITVVSSFLFVALVPPSRASILFDTPLSGLAQHVDLPTWTIGLLVILVGLAALLILVPAAHAALVDAEQLLHRLSVQRMFPGQLARTSNNARSAHSIDVAVMAAVLVSFASGAQVTWLSRAYGMAIALTLVLKVAAIARLRKAHQEPRPFTAPFDVRVMLPFAGLLAAVMLIRGDIPSLAVVALVGVLGTVLAAGRQVVRARLAEEEEPFELSIAPDISLEDCRVRSGNVLVCIRHPHSLAHVVSAIQQAGDRDIVVVTVRLLGIDVDEETGETSCSTREERYLFSRVAAITENYGRPARFLIVPARNVIEGIIAVAIRLRSSEVHVGESATLSADDQGRLLGEAWENADKPNDQNLRLVIHHDSGRTDSYHLGAHPPSLTSNDLDLIHRVWLDLVKAVGPHVHHHDVVRAALTQMEQQLSGPQREDALAVIRNIARPADEVTSAIRAGNYQRLRDLVRNRPASDLASVLTELSIEDQVVAFRIIPRKQAAAVFEYLSREEQESLIKAMAQEDVAALLNNMSPDDRTMFLEELPASITRQLLSLLTPAERSVALTLLGYPEYSVGRLMTPNYVSVHESWTVREVLDYIRTHGQDSETLNVVYVVDDQDLLIDDIRIREFLLAPLESRVVDLMDRRFVALKATDDEKTAVAMFRQYDRTALPITDTAGMLIGIVTIDDVLYVAEAAATQEIQRIGGSEALDEPYMRIAFGKMVRKRAGWLTALFLGEMLTATAMGAFEKEISRAVVLALFVPLIISSGGNSGSQAATLVIRALALGEVRVADWWRIIRREVMAGLALGTILGSIGFLRISIWSTFSDIYGPHWVLVGCTVAIALVGIVLWGTLVGSVLPLILRKLGFDPATSSAPFVATFVDVTGLVIYFTVALIVLGGTLLKQ